MTGRRAVVVAAIGALLLGGCGTGARQTPSAAEQVPRLGVLLDRVDGDLVAHRYAAARQDLRAMKAEVTRARAAGDLRETDAGLVLAAVDHLLSGLPSTSTTSGPTAGPTTSTTRPSPSASSKPARPRTSATPGSSPTASPSPTQGPTTAAPSSPSPTSSASVQVSPAAATSSATP